MGMLDHRRTWHYEVDADRDECVAAFARAFTSSRGLLAPKADWAIQRRSGGAVAIYKGRKGIGALGGIMSKTAALEADTALGSEVTFEATSEGGRTVCQMWLSGSGRAGVAGIFGATSDARFIRPYMQSVEKELRLLDPAAKVSAG